MQLKLQVCLIRTFFLFEEFFFIYFTFGCSFTISSKVSMKETVMEEKSYRFTDI